MRHSASMYYDHTVKSSSNPGDTNLHYSAVIMGAMASQIISLNIVYSTVYSGADQRKHQSSASLAFQRGIHRWPVNSPHKGPVTRKIILFDDVIMNKGWVQQVIYTREFTKNTVILSWIFMFTLFKGPLGNWVWYMYIGYYFGVLSQRAGHLLIEK